MSEVNKFLERFPDYPATPGQIAWARFCEQIGLRFLCEFGFENAESIAEDWMDCTGRTEVIQ